MRVILFSIGSFQLPGYSACILLGGAIATLLGLLRVRKNPALNVYDFIALEAAGVLGGLLGAKGLYLFVNAGSIEWARLLRDAAYFGQIMTGGFVFYGGLLGAIVVLFGAYLIFRVPVLTYFEEIVHLLPLAHAFGRMGCFLAGCCYGIPYDGPLAVTFPVDNPYTLGGEPLFPVQLVEAACLLVISLVTWLVARKKHWIGVPVYLMLYAPVRFALEYFRYDAERGGLGPFSTSQWISLALFVAATTYLVVRSLRERRTVR